MADISDTKPITASQVRSIHVALSRAGIDDDTYRDLLHDGYGVASCKDLSRRQASELLRHLGAPLRNPPGTRPKAPRQPKTKLPPGVTRLPSAAQRQLISDLVSEIAWRQEGGYHAWLKANQGIKRVATAQQAMRVIEGLKGLKGLKRR